MPGLFGRRLEARFEAVPQERVGVGRRQRQAFKRLVEILVEIATEVSGIVGMHARPQARGEQLRQIVVPERVEHAELHVGERADRQRNSLPHEPGDHGLVLEAPHAVIDPLNAEGIQRRGDRCGWPLLARMGDGVKAEPAAAVEHPRKLLRRVSLLAGIEADANQMLTERLGPFERLEGLPLREVPQEAHDQRGRDAQFVLRPGDRPRHAADHRLEGHAPRGVGLRIEEDLRADHVVGPGSLQIRPCQVMKIVFGAEHRRGGVVDVEKALQIGEGKRVPQRLRRFIWQRDAITAADLEGEFRLECALDVHMQLRLGSPRDEGGEPFGRNA